MTDSVEPELRDVIRSLAVLYGEPDMSVRDVLREAIVLAIRDDDSAHKIVWGGQYRSIVAKVVLDALRAHPVELFALLAEPKVCETCWGDGDLRRTDGYPPGLDEVGKPCVTCHGTGSVAVDVLDLLVQAGLLERHGAVGPHYDGVADRYVPAKPLFAAKDGTP